MKESDTPETRVFATPFWDEERPRDFPMHDWRSVKETHWQDMLRQHR